MSAPIEKTLDLNRTALEAGPRPFPGSVAPARVSWRKRLRIPLLMIGPLVVVLGAAYFYLTGGRYVSTDDAYVESARSYISPGVAGHVIGIDVHDNQRVAAGDVLFRIDDGTLKVAVEEAQARLANAKLSVNAAKATYRQRLTELKSAQDNVAFAERDFDRQKQLLSGGYASQVQFDKAQHALDAARQEVAGADQQIAAALAALGGDPDINPDNHPAVLEAKAQLDKANLDLADSVVRAPMDGIATKVDQLQVGDYVKVGAPVFSVVSPDDIWVEANFKETDLRLMRPGQSATIDIDTYSGHPFAGRVASVSPGTGSSFSLLPPENATGNWVKVVQRLPVRFTIVNPNAAMPLHAGLSATVEVDTGYRRPLLVSIESLLGLRAAAQ
jgi:membrane fusion protein (multidrug efflux system)